MIVSWLRQSTRTFEMASPRFENCLSGFWTLPSPHHQDFPFLQVLTPFYTVKFFSLILIPSRAPSVVQASARVGRWRHGWFPPFRPPVLAPGRCIGKGLQEYLVTCCLDFQVVSSSCSPSLITWLQTMLCYTHYFANPYLVSKLVEVLFVVNPQVRTRIIVNM